MPHDRPIAPEEFAQLGDPNTRNAVFDRLTDRMMPQLYGYARRIVVVGSDAEDVVQEALIKAYGRIGMYQKFLKKNKYYVIQSINIFTYLCAVK